MDEQNMRNGYIEQIDKCQKGGGWSGWNGRRLREQPKNVYAQPTVTDNNVMRARGRGGWGLVGGGQKGA